MHPKISGILSRGRQSVRRVEGGGQCRRYLCRAFFLGGRLEKELLALLCNLKLEIVQIRVCGAGSCGSGRRACVCRK